MHSSRALVVLTVTAALAWAAVAVDLKHSRAPVAVSRRILPELAAPGGRERIAELRWLRPAEPGQAPLAARPSMRLVRGPDGHMTFADVPGSVPDSGAVDELLGTLELLSYTRTLTAGEARGAGGLDGLGLAPARLILEVELAGGQVIRLRLGDRIPSIDRVWLARGERPAAHLIEGYAARALDRRREDLRSRRVVAVAPERMRAIEIHAGEAELLLTGSPARVHGGELGGHVRADAERMRALAQHLSTLTLARFVPAAGPDSGPGDHGIQTAEERADHAALTLRVVGLERTFELADIGPCPRSELPHDHQPPPLRLVTTSIGTGCVAAHALAEVAGAAADARTFFARALFDPRDLTTVTAARPGGPRFLLRVRGSAWTLSSAAAADPPAAALVAAEPGAAGAGAPEQPAAAEAARRWLDALHDSADGRLVPARGVDEMRPLLELEIRHTDASAERISFIRHPRHGLLARRQGEPVYLGLAPAAAELVAVEPLAFRSRQLLMLEPYGLREAIARDRGAVAAHLVRGELVDEWHARVPAGRPVRAHSVAVLRGLGRLRARAFIAAAAAPGHGLAPPRRRIEVSFDPGPLAADDAPVRHTVELGRDTAHGCLARLDGEPTVLELERRVCGALLAAWVQ